MIHLRKTGFGIEVGIDFTTDLGMDKTVSASIRDGKINLAATGDLNSDGIDALKDLTDIATIIAKRGIIGDKLSTNIDE